MSHNFYAEIRVFVILCQIRAFFGFRVRILFFGGSSLGTFHKGFKEHVQSLTWRFHFGGTVRFCFGTVMRFPILYHYALAEFVLTLKCSTRGFPSYRALYNLFFCWPRWNNFQKLKGDIMSGPPRDVSSVCGECLIISMRRLGSLSFYVRSGPSLDFVFVFYFSVAQV